MTAEIQYLDCDTRLDIPADRVLQAAIDADLQGVIVAGWDQEGRLYIASSYAKGPDGLWLAEKFKQRVLDACE